MGENVLNYDLCIEYDGHKSIHCRYMLYDIYAHTVNKLPNK